MASDAMGVKRTHEGPTGPVSYYSLRALSEQRGIDLTRLPYSVKVLLENVLRFCDGQNVDEDDVLALARWNPSNGEALRVFPFMPARVLLQDLTGVPAVVDLAAMRAAVGRLGGDAQKVNARHRHLSPGEPRISRVGRLQPHRG
jgi:aconitate hydratase